MVTGIVVALFFPMLIMPALGVSKDLWIILMSILSIIALPLTLLEYYFTKERITEETINQVSEKKIPFKLQLKAIFTDKYFVLLIVYFLVYTIGSVLKNVGLVYYCNYVLGTYQDGMTQTLVSVLGGIPMGIGIFLVWPLAKRFGKRNVTMVGFIIYAIGSAICWLNPTNMIMVLVGQFIKNIGGLPCAYVFMALFADTLDHMEWKTGFRSDGTAMSIYNIIMVAAAGICTGVFNFFLSKTGYVAPVIQSEYLTNIGQYAGLTTQKTMEQILALGPTDAVAFVQSNGTNAFITFAFVGLEVITGLACAGILLFVSVEKTVKRKQDVIRERQKALCLANGEEWIEPEVRTQLEEEQFAIEARNIFMEELKVKCEKNPKIDFDTELKKYDDKVEAARIKKENAKKKADDKEAAKKAKEEAKLAKKLAKMTPDQLKKREERLAKHQARDEAFWQKECVKGNAYYQKTQAELAAMK